MNFCFHHIGGRIPSQTRPNPETFGPYAPLKFVYPDSHAAIQHNLFLIVQALNEKKIDNRTANTYNRLFRACELNLRNSQAAGAAIKLDETPEADNSNQQPTPGDQSPDNDQGAQRDESEWDQPEAPEVRREAPTPFYLLSPEEQQARREAFEAEYFGSPQSHPVLEITGSPTDPLTPSVPQ
jgi:hypothetical protein